MVEPKDKPADPTLATNTPGGPTSVTGQAGVVLPQFILDRDVFADPSKTPAPKLAPITLPKDIEANPDPAWDMVELFDIKFGGKPMGGSELLKIADGGNGDYVIGSLTGPRVAATELFKGVRRDLADVLITAEQEIYAFLVQINGGSPINSAAEFDALMGIGSMGVYQFRRGLHAFGTAIDIDVNLNPYIPTGDGTTFGGEANSAFGAQQNTLLRKPVVDIYERACEFVFGKDQGASTAADAHFLKAGDKETTASVFTRFEKIDVALKWYLRLCFEPAPASTSLIPNRATVDVSGKQGRHDPVSLPDFSARLKAKFDADTGFQKRHPELTSALSDPTGAPVAALYQQVQDDHETLRRGWVHGDVTPVKTGAVITGVTVGSSRDPCNGFLGVRSWVAHVLRDTLGCRWGIVDFGGESGDVMHFDLGLTKLKRQDPLVKNFTPQQQRTYFTATRPPLIRSVSVKERATQAAVTVAAGTTTTTPVVLASGQTLVFSGARFLTGLHVQQSPPTAQTFTNIANLPTVTGGARAELKLDGAPTGQQLVRLRNLLPSANSLEQVLIEIQ